MKEWLEKVLVGFVKQHLAKPFLFRQNKHASKYFLNFLYRITIFRAPCYPRCTLLLGFILNKVHFHGHTSVRMYHSEEDYFRWLFPLQRVDN